MYTSFRIFKLSVKQDSPFIQDIKNNNKVNNDNNVNSDIYSNTDNYTHFFKLYIVIGDNYITFIKRQEMVQTTDLNEYKDNANSKNPTSNSINSSEKVLFTVNNIFHPSFSLTTTGRILSLSSLKLKFYTCQESILCYDHLNTQFLKINKINDMKMDRRIKELREVFGRVGGRERRSWEEVKRVFKKMCNKRI